MGEVTARGLEKQPEKLAYALFNGVIGTGAIDALYANCKFDTVLVVSGLPYRVPAVRSLLQSPIFSSFFDGYVKNDSSILVQWKTGGEPLVFAAISGNVVQVKLETEVANTIIDVLEDAAAWAGILNTEGEHVVDCKSPSPGPHYNVNLLMGNRIGYANALQTTPKSVVDRTGGGSFRSHAASQVLATRWDIRQEENGNPVNRQFYLSENGKTIFFSGNPTDPSVLSAVCTHGRNHTRIVYQTDCGLEISRKIFILPQIEGLPLATEVQQIEVINKTDSPRQLRIACVGMFGSCRPDTQWEDVLYSHVIMQSRILKNEDETLLAVGPDYYPPYTRDDQRFFSMLLRDEHSVQYPSEFTMNYNEFYGTGTILAPQGINRLTNTLNRKGPGFFAVAGDLTLAPNGMRKVDTFTGLISNKTNPSYDYHKTYAEEITALVQTFLTDGELDKIFDKSMQFLNQYSGFMKLLSADEQLNVYVNQTLPFQVLYQTFVSRSFCQTQKGYREMGFREIQDLFASMFYFVGMGMGNFVRQLLLEWASMIFEFGFAYHNFFWVGKEPGKWSDDPLWFVQAVYRYVNLTGDKDFLQEMCTMAGTNPAKSRSIIDTLHAILVYSGKISVGQHGLPLLDRADWNDTLVVDVDFIDGITKERLYKKQLEETGGSFGDAFVSDYSESVMNAFLLKLALDQTQYLAQTIGRSEISSECATLSKTIYDRIQTHTWKKNWFARVLLNRYKDGRYLYIGAVGDGFSIDPDIDGVYFLNCFTWSILADAASDEQVALMLDVVERTLKTPYGLKLVSPSDLGPITNSSATDHYFPGDRENGGVFKHACMMATSAMFKAAKNVADSKLAERLSQMAWWLVELVVPHRTLSDPYLVCGNPRFCTQYNNSDTGENIGPMLSGTSTWLQLTLMAALGVEYTCEALVFDPILKTGDTELSYQLNTGRAIYEVSIQKQEGFARMLDGKAVVRMNGMLMPDNRLQVMTDGGVYQVEILL